ncbi:DUF2795 domain-containing protein [Candidatus Roizmanbacteria bacterium]|nr:DUF2795 domain-containing protein [Candidatus Roizmanbacteria bacterium]
MADINPVQIQKYLQEVDYPCTREDIIAKAQKEGADEKVIAMLQELPDGEFHSSTEISKVLGTMD